MAEQQDPNELLPIEELLMANSIQVDAMAQMLIEKGFFTKDEYFAKLKEVQAAYMERARSNKWKNTLE